MAPSGPGTASPNSDRVLCFGVAVKAKVRQVDADAGVLHSAPRRGGRDRVALVTTYVDTSAWIKLLSREDTDQMRDFVTSRPDDGATLISSDLIHVELRRAALRIGMPLLVAAESLELLSTVSSTRGMLTSAGSRVFPSGPRGRSRSPKTLNAIHVETALAVGADELVTYDQWLADAANSLGLMTVSPGR